MWCKWSLTQVLDTPGDHVTRDYREGPGTLADIKFTAIDTSGVVWRHSAMPDLIAACL